MSSASKYKLVKRVGAGSFGSVHEAVEVSTGRKVAVKLETTDARYPQLLHEGRVMKQMDGDIGFPTVNWTGTQGSYNVMVYDLLGPSLEALFEFCGRKLTVKTVCQLAEEMLVRVQSVHSRGYLHRDIKPDNFLIGLDDMASVVYLVDFGLAKRYWDHRKGAHISYREGKQLTGTARYASVNTHAGFEQSRRDDLECLAHVLIYFLRGSLPWQGVQAPTKAEKYKAIYEMKVETTPKELCAGLPEEFHIFLEYTRSLDFEEVPDYDWCRGLFVGLAARLGIEYDGEYDWVTKSMHRKSSSLSSLARRKKKDADEEEEDEGHHRKRVEVEEGAELDLDEKGRLEVAKEEDSDEGEGHDGAAAGGGGGGRSGSGGRSHSHGHGRTSTSPRLPSRSRPLPSPHPGRTPTGRTPRPAPARTPTGRRTARAARDRAERAERERERAEQAEREREEKERKERRRERRAREKEHSSRHREREDPEDRDRERSSRHRSDKDREERSSRHRSDKDREERRHRSSDKEGDRRSRRTKSKHRSSRD